VLARRYPLSELVLAPAVMQGDSAPDSVVRALRQLQDEDVDVIIVARGGGSADDLWAFNDERIARAIYASRIPVVSAIGHETDTTVADLVADVRASTPSVAAEIVAPDIADLSILLTEMMSRAKQLATGNIERSQRALIDLRHRLSLASPVTQLAAMQSVLNSDVARMQTATGRLIERKSHHLDRALAFLQALDPDRQLRRGYAHITQEATGDTIRSAAMLNAGEQIRATFADGSIIASVDDTFPLTPFI
jgi:exodeoxyribonuclease VII large subunit